MRPGIDFPLWYIPVGIWLLGWFFLTILGSIFKKDFNFGNFIWAATWPISLPVIVIWKWTK